MGWPADQRQLSFGEATIRLGLFCGGRSAQKLRTMPFFSCPPGNPCAPPFIRVIRKKTYFI
jgi:hypothetical protein